MRPVPCEYCKKPFVDGDEIWWAGQVVCHLSCAEEIGLAKRPSPEEVWGTPMHWGGKPCKECDATGVCIHKYARYITYTYFQEPELPYRYPAAFD